jgi:three-Cys-motif partner protein
MPVKGAVPWERPPHTAAKHRIYDLYLRMWFPILLSSRGYKSATYAEGFAGPGIYSKDEEGSPIVAMRAFLETPELRSSSKPVRFLFIDDDERCTRLLKEQLKSKFPQRPRPLEQMPVVVKRGKCAELMETELDGLNAWGQPILAVLDSFGNAPVPSRLIRRLATNPASEVIVTLGPQHFIRFVSDLPPDVDDVFGGDTAWRSIAQLDDADEKRRRLLTAYRSMLKRAGFSHLLDFEMIDQRGESLYLIFGTTHERGLQKMKEAVWQIDPVYGVRFRDPRDEMNEPLFLIDQPQDATLQRLLLQRLREAGPAVVEELRRFALFETVYREQHVIPALRRLRDQGRIQVEGSRTIRRGDRVQLSQPRSGAA